MSSMRRSRSEGACWPGMPGGMAIIDAVDGPESSTIGNGGRSGSTGTGGASGGSSGRSRGAAGMTTCSPGAFAGVSPCFDDSPPLKIQNTTSSISAMMPARKIRALRFRRCTSAERRYGALASRSGSAAGTARWYGFCGATRSGPASG